MKRTKKTPKARGKGKPFQKGYDPRRNLKGPVPELTAIREAIRRDGLDYVDELYRLARSGNAAAVRVAIEQILGRPPASITLTGPNGGPIQVEDARARLAQKFAALAARSGQSGTNPKPQ